MALRSETLRYETTSVNIYFPEGEIRCSLCPLLETYARKQCRKTGEYILDDRTIGMWCPLLDYTGEPINNMYVKEKTDEKDQ